MEKKKLVRAIIKVIENMAERLKLTIEDRGTGMAFEGTIWRGVFDDTSGIPNIVAKNGKDGGKKISVELRSFWGYPEIDIRMGHELMVLRYGDAEWDKNDEITHTEAFSVSCIEVDTHDPKSRIEGIYQLIEEIREAYECEAQEE